MKIHGVMLICAIALIVLPSAATAAMDHSAMISGPFESGPEVTEKCISCHDTQAEAILDSVHWNWAGPSPNTVGQETATNLGKTNIINNYCIAVTSSEPRCTTCHIGYGWTDDTFDFSDKTNIDCLICHEQTGTYKKDPPLKDAEGNFVAIAGTPYPEVDLTAAAQSVGLPTPENCGKCHFYGGGGEDVKHGDLYSAMISPSNDLDVHLGKLDFQCQDCHTTTDHKIAGVVMAIPAMEGRVTCTDTNCHTDAPHTGVIMNDLNQHSKTVACQVCHIPTFSNELPTKLNWDWSTAGQDIDPVPTDEYGKPTYSKLKGDFVWGKNIVPTYGWYDGNVERYLLGDTLDPDAVTTLNMPVGDISDENSMIYAFKVHSGKQISDAVNKYLIVPDLFGGADAYWASWDWDKSAASGMAAVDMPYSGEYEFVQTKLYMSVNHEVAPKENALKCDDCHTDDGRMDFAALGYNGDPKDVGGRFSVAEPDVTPTEDTPGTPGFEFVVAFAGLLSAVLLFRRK